MSQILATRPKTRTIYGDLHFEKPAIRLRSTVGEAACHVCKREISEGFGLTAKKIADKIVLVCSSHS